MRILAVLWTVCLVRLCSAGFWCCGGSKTDDDEVTVRTVQGGSNEVSTENLRAVPPQHSIVPAGQFSSEDSTVPQPAGKDGDVSSLKSDPGTIDVNHPDNSQCQAFDYYYDDNLTRLIAPISGKSINELKDDTKKIWSLGSGETFEYAKVYLNKDKKAEVIFVVVKKSSEISRTYYAKSESGWTSCNNHKEKINDLKTEATKTKAAIDIGSEKETDQCYLISTELLGLEVKMFVPKPDYYATEVKNDSKSLLEAAEDNGERCLSCDIYTKGNNNPLLLITLKVNNELDYEYFEKEGAKWKSITQENFSQKKNAMQAA
ncbi:hypothetical protein BEWA_038680 [Theileria equi strain WA]|uniref:Signal peptide containing protein n=1 Tax=Theileria equi strain WA TaxID=1537102 RepID=L1LF18_THEEQ|nr:hypothetical protein BEWA_038680 [Theileria equi strain WA]EKX73830.1 hypothetical protein BEWA_038680 [Theileria equi strain WA]|eukprot:XP_004833282.1 hypothetical protein BEWA_038680 [Theileria equi strain WA]